MPLPCLCPSSPLSRFLGSNRPRPPSLFHPPTHQAVGFHPSIPPFPPWELLAQRSPSSSHWPQEESLCKFLLQAAFNPLLQTLSYVGSGARKESPYVFLKTSLSSLLIQESFPKVHSCLFVYFTLLLGTNDHLYCMWIVPLALPFPFPSLPGVVLLNLQWPPGHSPWDVTSKPDPLICPAFSFPCPGQRLL